ncbi:MAG TPA: hypothetical protein PKN61_06430 [Acidobacteriota bacterium]|nr:hypothetical protein [Acidobacteriota bacterium]HNU01100.1 hypothetical protein [Acidobacteriota bacterium]HPB27623.1 hypothetical protein [Acidobacteriota bacterium]HQO25217.1 hypothetical protein [Acidobacteriota bacterium]HQP73682.1 hypothetical protein [Acidobacteriota bacterium]
MHEFSHDRIEYLAHSVREFSYGRIKQSAEATAVQHPGFATTYRWNPSYPAPGIPNLLQMELAAGGREVLSARIHLDEAAWRARDDYGREPASPPTPPGEIHIARLLLE